MFKLRLIQLQVTHEERLLYITAIEQELVCRDRKQGASQFSDAGKHEVIQIL